jgi:hypothetical protein
MDEPMTKTKILEMIQSGRKSLESTLSQLSEEQMTQPGVQNDWSVKDILAHITEWERRTVQWIHESLRGEVPQRPAPGMAWDDLDGLNEQIYMLNKDRPLSEVLDDFRSAHHQSLQAVEALTEEDLIDPQRFAWRAGEPMWHMVAANTWLHYQEHGEAIRKRLREEETG